MGYAGLDPGSTDNKYRVLVYSRHSTKIKGHYCLVKLVFSDNVHRHTDIVSPGFPLLHDGHGVDPWRTLHGCQLHLLQRRASGLGLTLLCRLLLLFRLLLLLVVMVVAAGGALGRLVCRGFARRLRGGVRGSRERCGDTDCHTLGR